MASTATWQSYLQPYEVKYGLPSGLLGALVRAESVGQVGVRSPVGAIGLTQLMPATAASLGINPNDPIQNLRGGAMYLAQQLKRFGGDVSKALAAYNAGPGAVQKYGGIPPYQETRDYVKRVQEYWKQSSRYGKTGFNGMLTSPAGAVGPAPSRKVVPGLDPGDVAKLQIAYTDEPTIGNAILQNRMDQQSKFDADYGKALSNYNYSNARAQSAAITGSLMGNNTGGVVNPGLKGWFKTPGGFVQNRREGELGWQFLQRLGHGFGLQNDPGNNQTYGGQHTSGSLHYNNNAIDFGDARNPWDKLNQWYSWINARRNILGVAQLLNEGDHIHVGLG